jgi:hypothetical protein
MWECCFYRAKGHGKRQNCSKTVADPKYIEKLRNVIFQRHGCESSWIESLPVHDVFNGQIVWDGFVEVFRLSEHPKAKIGYAWIDQGGIDDTRAIIETVLELPPVESPLSAVQTSMIADFMCCL